MGAARRGQEAEAGPTQSRLTQGPAQPSGVGSAPGPRPSPEEPSQPPRHSSGMLPGPEAGRAWHQVTRRTSPSLVRPAPRGLGAPRPPGPQARSRRIQITHSHQRTAQAKGFQALRIRNPKVHETLASPGSKSSTGCGVEHPDSPGLAGKDSPRVAERAQRGGGCSIPPNPRLSPQGGVTASQARPSQGEAVRTGLRAGRGRALYGLTEPNSQRRKGPRVRSQVAISGQGGWTTAGLGLRPGPRDATTPCGI